MHHIILYSIGDKCAESLKERQSQQNSGVLLMFEYARQHPARHIKGYNGMCAGRLLNILSDLCRSSNSLQVNTTAEEKCHFVELRNAHTLM